MDAYLSSIMKRIIVLFLKCSAEIIEFHTKSPSACVGL